jgi:hypothetical protein
MKLEKVCTEVGIFSTDDSEKHLETLLAENCQLFPDGPLNDENQEGGLERHKGNNVRDLITAFMICNHVSLIDHEKLQKPI